MKKEYEVVIRPKETRYWSSSVTRIVADFYHESYPGISLKVDNQIIADGEAIICRGRFQDSFKAAVALRNANHSDCFFDYNLDQFRIGLREVGEEDTFLEMLDYHKDSRTPALDPFVA